LRERPILPPCGDTSQLTVNGDEPRAKPCEPAPRVECGELPLEMLDPSVATGDRCPHDSRERMRQLGGMAAAHRDPARDSGKRRPAADDVHSAAQSLDPDSCRGMQPAAELIDAAEEFVLSRHHELGRR
jgi:hypothetical protein